MTGKIVSAICHGAYALSNAKFRNRTLIVEDELKETSAIFVTQNFGQSKLKFLKILLLSKIKIAQH